MKALRIVLVMLLSLCVLHSEAQFSKVEIGVNGLTCSQCSRTVEMSLRKLDFVADVQMNLQHTEGTIALKPGKKVDMDQVAQAVINAGFSLRYLTATLQVDNTVNANGGCFAYNGDQYVLAEGHKLPAKGTAQLKFIGKKYLSKGDFKKAQSLMKDVCGNTTGKTYYVTM
jgi:copper chaperone CopZ